MSASFTIVKNIGILSKKTDGSAKEVNLISWFGKEPKYDIREWNVDHTICQKGITFTNEEFVNLKELLRSE